jgi:hypothetical protein
MSDKDFEVLGRKLSEAAERGDAEAQAVLDRLRRFKDDPEDTETDWLTEAAIRWESEHPELAEIAVRVVNTLTSGGV